MEYDRSFDKLSLDSKYFAKHLDYPGTAKSNDPRYPGHVFDATLTTTPGLGPGGFGGLDFARKTSWHDKSDNRPSKSHNCAVGKGGCKKVRRSILSKRAGCGEAGLPDLLGWRGMKGERNSYSGSSDAKRNLTSPSRMSVDLEMIRNRANDSGVEFERRYYGKPTVPPTAPDIVYGDKYSSRLRLVGDGNSYPNRYRFVDEEQQRHPGSMDLGYTPNLNKKRFRRFDEKMSDYKRNGRNKGGCILEDLFADNDDDSESITADDFEDQPNKGSVSCKGEEYNSEYDSEEELAQYGIAESHSGIALAVSFINPLFGLLALLASC